LRSLLKCRGVLLTWSRTAADLSFLVNRERYTTAATDQLREFASGKAIR
jgi:hypothetical protein